MRSSWYDVLAKVARTCSACQNQLELCLLQDVNSQGFPGQADFGFEIVNVPPTQGHRLEYPI